MTETELAPMNNTLGLTSISLAVPDSDPSATNISEPFLDDDYMSTFNNIYTGMKINPNNCINLPPQQITHSISPSEKVAQTENKMIFDDPTYAVTSQKLFHFLKTTPGNLHTNIGIKVSASNIGTGEVSEPEPEPALVQVQKIAPDSHVTLKSTDSTHTLEVPGSVFDDPMYDMGLNLKNMT